MAINVIKMGRLALALVIVILWLITLLREVVKSILMLAPDLHRLNINTHLTASALILCQGQILLVNHKRLNAWVPPGGHVEPGELPHETACRETKEETGITIQILPAGNLPISCDPEAFFLPQPFYMQCVKAVEQNSPVYHVDLAYLCSPEKNHSTPPEIIINHESKHARWFKPQELGTVKLAKNVKEACMIIFQKLGTLQTEYPASKY